jgi:hypothetical protein
MTPITEEEEAVSLQLARHSEEEEDQELKPEIRQMRRERRPMMRKHPELLDDPLLENNDIEDSDDDGDENIDQPAVVSPEDDFLGRRMVRGATCVHIWNFLHDDGLEDEPEQVDRGWLAALKALRRAVKVATYAPSSVLHR